MFSQQREAGLPTGARRQGYHYRANTRIDPEAYIPRPR
jgi:hypothetical protein